MSAPKSSRPQETYRIVALPGDGIGPEVCHEALRVLRLALKGTGAQLQVIERPIGGAAIDAGGAPFPGATREACLAADAVLLGAVGGPKWDGLSPEKRPEKGLLDLRRTLGVYANLRPVKARAALLSTSPLREEIVRGTDLLIVRELLGDVYFGEPRGIEQKPRRRSTPWRTRRGNSARRGGGVRRRAHAAKLSRRWTRPTCSKRRVSGATCDRGGARLPRRRAPSRAVDSCAMALVRRRTPSTSC